MIESNVLEKYQIKPHGLERRYSKPLASLHDFDKSKQKLLPLTKMRTKPLAIFPQEYGTNKIHSNIFHMAEDFFSKEDMGNVHYRERTLPFPKVNIMGSSEDLSGYSILGPATPIITPMMIHNDSLAGRLTKFYGAEALTIGRDIFFAPSKSDLSNRRGKALLVHEITHVLQQEKNPELSKQVSTNMMSLSEQSELEREAENAEKNFLKLSSLREYDKRHPPDDLYLMQSSISHAMKNMLKVNLSEFVSTFLSQNADLNLKARREGPVSSSVKVSTATPFLAQEGRAVSPPIITSLPEPSGEVLPSPTMAESPAVDVGRLADQVYDMIARRLKMERDRRGIR